MGMKIKERVKMIKYCRIKRHCGHYENKIFIGRKKKFDFWIDWEKYNRCQECEGSNHLKAWEVASYLAIGCGILMVLYFMGIIQ